MNVITKAKIQGREDPVLLVMNESTLLEDPNENESLATPFDMMRGGIKLDMTPVQHGGKCGFTVDTKFFPFQYDGEKIYVNISKPSEHNLDTLEWFELNRENDPDTPVLNDQDRVSCRKQSHILAGDIPLNEWQKCLAMLPEDVVTKTLQNTTQYYLNAEHENCEDPRRHMKPAYRGIRHKRRNEIVASDMMFPSHVSSRGNTYSQFFTMQKTDLWDVHPMKKE